jgi:ADP-heptose:LPS heptosyltransferase
MSLLFIHTGGVGDFIVAAPQFHRYANTRVWDIAGIPERGALAVAAGWARKALSIDAIEFWTVYSEPSPRLKEHLAAYDEVIVWLGEDSAAEARCVDARLAHVRFMSALPPQGWGRHAADFYAQQLGIPTVPPDLPITPGPPRRDVFIHPGSGSPGKNWPLENFLQLAQTLEAPGQQVRWLRGPAEEDITLPGAADIVPPATLPDLGARLAGGALYVGNDSGITHLAAAVGCPVVALFKDTSPALWGPRGRRVTILHDPEGPSLDAALREAEHILTLR